MSPEYLMVPVPSDRVQEVYELLARPPHSSEGSPVDGDVAKPLPWSEELLFRAYEESPDRMKQVLHTLADRHDQTVTMEDLTGVLGLERGRVAGVLGAFGRRWKNRYRQGEANLPFKAHWSSSAGMTVYSMEGPVAVVFVKARERE